MDVPVYHLLIIAAICTVSGKPLSYAGTTCEDYRCSNNSHKILWRYRNSNNCEINCTFWNADDPKMYTIASKGKCGNPGRKIDLFLLGYCVTTTETNETAYVIPCPYDTGRRHEILGSRSLILNATTAQEQNTFMCSGLNRQGDHCQSCNESFGQSVFTFDLSCYKCGGLYSGWFLYLFFETFFLVIFLVVIMLFQISPNKGSMAAFVLFCQLSTVYLSLGTEQYFKYMFEKGGSIYIQMIKTFYGFWNLDFFRSVMPPFCVGANLNNLDVLMLQYIAVAIPTVLLVVAWFIVDLHERGFRPVVAVWRPFRRGLSHFSVTNDPKRTIVSFLATLVTLSSTKIFYIAISVTTSVHAYDCCGVSKRLLYLQPDIPLYSPKHAVYIFLSALMVSMYVFLPVIILTFYSLQSFQDRLNKYCIHSHNIQMFAEAFYSIYKDGSNGEWDTRLFSTAYFFFRMLVVICLKLPHYQFLGIALVHGFVLGLICLIRPYKCMAYTFLDALFFFIFLVASVFIIGISFTNNQCKNITFIGFLHVSLFMLIGTPLIYIVVQVIRYFFKALEFINIRSILNWRRRGYVEIGPYEAEDSVAADKNWVRTNEQQQQQQ